MVGHGGSRGSTQGRRDEHECFHPAHKEYVGDPQLAQNYAYMIRGQNALGVVALLTFILEFHSIIALAEAYIAACCLSNRLAAALAGA
jgi:hypothetical protein